MKAHLRCNNIHDFTSLKEVLNFQKNFSALRNQIITNHEQLIEQEKATLDADILQLDKAIETNRTYFKSYLLKDIEAIKQKLTSLSTPGRFNFMQRIANYVKQRFYKKKIYDLEFNLEYQVDDSVRELVQQYQDKKNRYHYITSNFSDAVTESSSNQIKLLEKKLRVIDEVKNSIYGALGEHQVVKELEHLSDENSLINDFALTFHPAIYSRQENDYIKTIQIDHLLVTASGIFLIETKNWSEKSLNSLDLRSPVEQVKRTNFALFRLLTEGIANNKLHLNQHHWGERKIPLRNLIVLTNSRPKEEFQHVKILSLDELLSYVRYFKPVFSSEETEAISTYLLGLNERKHLTIRRR